MRLVRVRLIVNQVVAKYGSIYKHFGFSDVTIKFSDRPAQRTVSIRRLGKEAQQVTPLAAALEALADEAIEPDVRRLKRAA